MSETECITALRWLVAGIIMVCIFAFCPALVSTPNDGVVLFGIASAIVGVLVASLSIVGRLDTYYAWAYRDIRDAFFR